MHGLQRVNIWPVRVTLAEAGKLKCDKVLRHYAAKKADCKGRQKHPHRAMQDMIEKLRAIALENENTVQQIAQLSRRFASVYRRMQAEKI